MTRSWAQNCAPVFGLICFTIAAPLIFDGCSSEPKAPEVPAWTQQPTRTVEGGYIIYVASSEDRSPEKAHFKAQSVAFEDLANECSFPPKGARTEDTFDIEKTGVLHTVYVKVAVDFQSCEDAKNALKPEDIQRLANVAMTEQIKSYQEQYESPPKEMLEDCSDDGTTPPNSDSDGDNCDVPPQTQQVLNTRQAPPVTVISSPVQYYVVQQQVWYAKQEVILAPPATYAPGTPQNATFTNSITQPAKQMSTYAAANPTVRTNPQPWSTTRGQAVQSYQHTQVAQRAAMNRQMNRQQGHRGNRGRGGYNGNPRRRRRRNEGR